MREFSLKRINVKYILAASFFSFLILFVNLIVATFVAMPLSGCNFVAYT